MLIAENDRPILKGEYPVDIQGREHEVTGQLESQGEALFWIAYRNVRNQKKLKHLAFNDLFASIKIHY